MQECKPFTFEHDGIEYDYYSTDYTTALRNHNLELELLEPEPETDLNFNEE